MKNLPCPFCGEQRISFKEVDTCKYGAAYCVSCGGTGPEVRTDYDTSENAEWHEDATKEWNNRQSQRQQLPCSAHRKGAVCLLSGENIECGELPCKIDYENGIQLTRNT